MEVLHAALPEEIQRERKTVSCKRPFLFVLQDCHCAKPVNTLWTCFCWNTVAGSDQDDAVQGPPDTERSDSSDHHGQMTQIQTARPAIKVQYSRNKLYFTVGITNTLLITLHVQYCRYSNHRTSYFSTVYQVFMLWSDYAVPLKLLDTQDSRLDYYVSCSFESREHYRALFLLRLKISSSDHLMTTDSDRKTSVKVTRQMDNIFHCKHLFAPLTILYSVLKSSNKLLIRTILCMSSQCYKAFERYLTLNIQNLMIRVFGL